jgi:hypothetical protein
MIWNSLLSLLNAQNLLNLNVKIDLDQIFPTSKSSIQTKISFTWMRLNDGFHWFSLFTTRLWPVPGLLVQCNGFKCEVDSCQLPPGQESQLIISRHFYPKFHPELNFTEQHWGLAKHLLAHHSKCDSLSYYVLITKAACCVPRCLNSTPRLVNIEDSGAI